jgi:hypothetical protein
MQSYLSFDIGLRTLAVSRGSKHADDKLLHFDSVNVFDLIQDDTINVASSPIECLLDRAVPNLNGLLPKLLEGLRTDNLIIVIESQPTGRFAKNVKMKVVSHVLQSLLRTLVGPKPKIIFQSATVKLQAAELFVLNDLAAVTEDTAATVATVAKPKGARTKKALRSEHYRQNKKTSVTACDALNADLKITDIHVGSVMDVWKTVEKKKRDDCADAIWQLIGFVGFHRPERVASVRHKKSSTATVRRKRTAAVALGDLDMCDDV